MSETPVGSAPHTQGTWVELFFVETSKTQENEGKGREKDGKGLLTATSALSKLQKYLGTERLCGT